MNKFKVGDWVTTKAGYTKQISGLTRDACDTLSIGNTSVGINVVFKNEIELWQPKEGEYCCFHNGTEQFTVAKFQNHADNTDTRFRLVSCYGKWTEIFKYCEPFIGELPSFLKE